MNQTDCFCLGYVKKPFGFGGELAIHLDVDDPSDYKKLESVFILMEGKLIPFFIETLAFRPNSAEATVRFQGVDNEEKASRLSGRELYLPLDLLPPLSGNRFYFHEVEGFQAVDEQLNPIGRVEQVLDLPGNPLFQIMKGRQEILVPVRDAFIERLDRENRRIVLRLPDGLVDVYTP
jgi:16S rRNA processing protein RimM